MVGPRVSRAAKAKAKTNIRRSSVAADDSSRAGSPTSDVEIVPEDDSARYDTLDKDEVSRHVHPLIVLKGGIHGQRRLSRILASVLFALHEGRRAIDPEGTSLAAQVQPLTPLLNEPLTRAQGHQLMTDATLQLGGLIKIRKYILSVILCQYSLI